MTYDKFKSELKSMNLTTRLNKTNKKVNNTQKNYCSNEKQWSIKKFIITSKVKGSRNRTETIYFWSSLKIILMNM